MRRRAVTVVGVLSATVAPGCGSGAVVISLDLPPGTVRSEGRDLAFHGTVRPADARVELRGADGRVTQDADGRIAVQLVALRVGRSALTLRGMRAGHTSATTRVAVRRGGRLGPPRREPQAARGTGYGSPGALDATGGRIDIGIGAFALQPRRVRAWVTQIVSWHNLDHADHLLRFDGAAAQLGRVGYDERATIGLTRAGLVRYRCALHPWVRGEIDVRSAR